VYESTFICSPAGWNNGLTTVSDVTKLKMHPYTSWIISICNTNFTSSCRLRVLA